MALARKRYVNGANERRNRYEKRKRPRASVRSVVTGTRLRTSRPTASIVS